MKISELAKITQTPLSTLKYWIRIGLVPAGERLNRTQASYSEDHVRRVRFVKILRTTAKLPVETIEQVLRAMTGADPTASHPAYEVLACLPLGHESLEPDALVDGALVEEVTQTLRELPWTGPDERHFHAAELAQSIQAIRDSILPDYGRRDLEALAAAAWQLSEAEFAAARSVPQTVADDDVDGPVLRAILGTILLEPILLALRRNANTARAMAGAVAKSTKRKSKP